MQGISVCWFCILQLYYIHWLALVFSDGVFRVFYGEDHVICKEWEFYFFFSNLGSFYFFFCSYCCGKTCQTVLNSSSESGHTCLVPDFRGNAFNFSPLRIIFARGSGNRTPIWPSNSTPGHTHQGNQNWKRQVYSNVHHSTVYNSRDMEAT